MLGKTEGRRRKGWQRMRWLDSITNSTDMSLSNQSLEGGAAVHGVTKSWTQLSFKQKRDIREEGHTLTLVGTGS